MTEHRWCVYIHTNKINKKKYIGITSQEPNKRWLNGLGYEPHLPIGRAIHKYGWDNFTHDIIVSNVSEEQAKHLEMYLIKKMRTQENDYGYNITCGGDGVVGYRHTSDSKQKMSISKSGANHPNYGKHLSESTRNKISLKLVGNSNASGCIRSDITRERMSKSKQKPVYMIKNGCTVERFDSAKIAESITGISRKNISACCNKIRKHAGGYEWKFA